MGKPEHGAGRAEQGDVQMIHELMGFQRDLLAVIAGLERPSGQQVKTELEATSGREVTHGRL